VTDKELAEIAQGYLAEIARLRAENARLREALKRIAEYRRSQGAFNRGFNLATDFKRVQALARDALGKS